MTATFRRTAIFSWIVAVVVFGLKMRTQGWRLIPSGDPVRDELLAPRSDFGAFYAAGLLIREAPGSLYDESRQEAVQSRVFGFLVSNSQSNFIAFPYPAAVALIFVPFTFLEFRSAYLEMVLLNSVLLATCLGMIASRLRLDRDQSTLLVIGSASSLAAYAVLAQGQLSGFALLLIVAVVSNLQAGRFHRAGLWAGFLALKPTLLPVWLFWLAFRRQWGALACALCSAVAMMILSLVIVGTKGAQAYLVLSHNYVNAHYQVNDPTKMPNMRAIIELFSLGEGAWLVAVAGIVCSLALVARTNGTSPWGYCALLLATILVAPHIWYHDLNAIFLVFAIALSQSEKLISPIGRWSAVAAMLLPWALTGDAMRPALPLGIVACFVWFVYLATRDPDVNQRSSHSLSDATSLNAT